MSGTFFLLRKCIVYNYYSVSNKIKTKSFMLQFLSDLYALKFFGP